LHIYQKNEYTEKTMSRIIIYF